MEEMSVRNSWDFPQNGFVDILLPDIAFCLFGDYLDTDQKPGNDSYILGPRGVSWTKYRQKVVNFFDFGVAGSFLIISDAFA